MTLKNYRDLGTRPSLTHLYLLLQISANNTSVRTGRRVLLIGGPNHCKSCVPPFAQPSEVWHAIRYKFTIGGRESRQFL
jgi:hypothetical protein